MVTVGVGSRSVADPYKTRSFGACKLLLMVIAFHSLMDQLASVLDSTLHVPSPRLGGVFKAPAVDVPPHLKEPLKERIL